MVARLVRVTEKRTHKIPSCRVDKELLLDIGNVIESSIRKGEEVSYSLSAQSRDIQSKSLKEFATEPPKDAEEISMSLGKRWSFPRAINVKFDLEEEYLGGDKGKISVSDPEAIWVHGVADRLMACFEKKRLGYRVIAERGEIRVVISILLDILLFFSFGYVLSRISSLSLQDIAIILVLVGMYFLLVLDFSLKRLFPYFELENRPLPRKARKWILGVIIGSGLLPALVLRLLGL